MALAVMGQEGDLAPRDRADEDARDTLVLLDFRI